MNKSFRIPVSRMKYLNDCYRQSPILHMCSHMITTQLLNNGITFCQGGCKSNTVKLSAKEESEVEEIWIPFCKDVIDSILCYGFVTVCITDGVPRVLLVGTYQLNVEITLMGFTYKVMSVTAVDQELPDCLVFDHFGHKLTPDGEFTSIVSKVIPRLLFLKQLRETAVAMEVRRANNTVFSEIKEATNASAKEGTDYDYYADGNSSELQESMKFNRNSTNVSILNQQKDLYDKYLGRDHAKKAERTLESVIPLPNGHHMQAPPQNTGRGDLGGLHKALIEDVCATLGVPRSMIMAESGGLGQSSDTEGAHEVFQHTIIYYKKKLGTCLSTIYNMINSDTIKKKIDFSKLKDPYEAKAKYSVTVYFPVTPFVTNESLRSLYEQGVIEWKTYAKYALANLSLPSEDLNNSWGKKGRPPIDDLLFEKPPDPVIQQNSGGGANLNKKRQAETGKVGGQAKKPKKDDK